MRRLLFSVTLFLLAVGIYRTLSGGQPLTLTSLLSGLSSLDLDFSKIYDSLSNLRNALYMPSVKGYSLTTIIGAFFKWFQNLFVALLTVPVSLVRELAEFLYSVLQFTRILRR